MLKRCLLAVIVALLVTSSQIAAAEDWSSVRNFNSKAELARWIEAGRRQGQTEFNFTLSNMTVTAREMSNEIAVDAGGRLAEPDNGSYNYYTYYVNELPGTHVANAYRSGDTSKLTAEELKLYNVAVEIVNEANKKYGTPRAKELYIHNEICRRASPIRGDEDRYYRNSNGDYLRDENGHKRIKPFATAIGVLNNGYNGQGNCSGYSDAFYMLCRMLNLNVVRVGGSQIGGNPHAWNAITFSGFKAFDDGKIYFVDVMWDDDNNDVSEFFNKSAEFFRQDHSWNYVGL